MSNVKNLELVNLGIILLTILTSQLSNILLT